MKSVKDIIKQQLFGDYAPEDQDWAVAEFMKDTPDIDWAATEERYGRGVVSDVDVAGAIQATGQNWFKKVGFRKVKDRNSARDRGEDVSGITPEQKAEAATTAKATTDRGDAEARQKQINDDIDAFYKQMMEPVDPNDPEIARVAAMAGRNAADNSFGRGIRGGAAEENTQRYAGDAAASMFAQERARRQELGSAALGQRSQSGLSQLDYLDRQRQFGAQQQQYREGMDYQNAYGNWERGKSQSQAGWGLATGLLGGIAGGVAGIPGGPAGIAAGAGGGFAGGMQLGAGLAGASYGAPPYRRYSRGN